VRALPAEQRGRLDPGLDALAHSGARRSALDVIGAEARRAQLGSAASRLHETWDVLVTPTMPIPAFAAGRLVPEGWPAPGWSSWTPFTYPFNLTQQPALSVPCGFTGAGLPVGLQIVGARHAEGLVLRVGAALERALPQPTLAPREEEAS
jgi:aspartyl-tRNA(Asn)/glutamyl-tRNA(Gln) amidotransferase subunit A